MSDVPPAQPAKPPNRSKRWLIIALVGAVAIAAVSFVFSPPSGLEDEADDGGHPRRVVYRVKHKPEPPRLGIEYHFDRNAIVDSRLVGSQILGLAASGNLVTFDAESFKARMEKVLRRRATCLGPADKTHVLVGISNGSIVRVAASDLAIEEVTDVPGQPRWIGKRAKDGALIIAFQPEAEPEGRAVVRDEGVGRTYEVGSRPVLFLDSKDRLWYASGGKVQVLDLVASTRKEVAWKAGWPGLRGFAELADGQIWAFGGADQAGEMESYVVRLLPGQKPVLVYEADGKRPVHAAPSRPITHVLEEQDPPRVLAVSHDGVFVSDSTLNQWQPLDAMVAGHRESDAMVALGQAHDVGHRVLLTLARGGFMEVTAEFTRRHTLEGQNSVSRPSGIVRLTSGMALYGDGGPLFYKGGGWHPLPEPIMPPAELMGLPRPGEKERLWAAMTTIPIEGEVSYVIAKAGPPRNYVGHIHGLRDVFLTARWDGKVLTVLGREELPIEPDDTFATPDKQLWNVDDQGLWSFSGGHWHMVMRAGMAMAGGGNVAGGRGSTAARGHGHFNSAIGEPLHFAETDSPFYGLPSAAPSWSLVRLDSNEAGGVPLIDEVPVKLDGRRLLLRDLTIWGNRKEELLLATDQGLCGFNVKWGNCELLKPEGLGDEVSLFMRDGTKRLWLGGRGLWVLRDRKHADEVHPAVPMLADTRVVALAETPDGRLAIGSEDRGVIFLSIPQGWFQRPPESQVALPSWERSHAHEPSYLDRGVVIRECRSKAGSISEAVTAGLLAGLRELAEAQGPRVRVRFEDVFEGRPDIFIRGAEPETLAEGVMPLVEKLGNKAHWSVLKRFGPRGSDAVELKACPQ
ncbi:MAG TPA: hypothetical protein VF550_14315 [Polyangia bacterium]